MPDWTFMISIGIILIMLGFFLIAFGMLRSVESAALEDRITTDREKKERVKGGGVILIGPVPIVFGTDKRYALLLMILVIVFMLLAIIFLK
ncbi:MAG: TIGR00304 family protein [Candidatus Methanoperedens sp.]|nr:TIGR00304 family protein [Candidatus Methanoperedens sp.]